MPPQNVMLDRKSGVGGRNDVNCSVRVVVVGGGVVDVGGVDNADEVVENNWRWVASSFRETGEARHGQDQRH